MSRNPGTDLSYPARRAGGADPATFCGDEEIDAGFSGHDLVSDIAEAPGRLPAIRGFDEQEKRPPAGNGGQGAEACQAFGTLQHAMPTNTIKYYYCMRHGCTLLRGLPSQVKGAGFRVQSRRCSWVRIPFPAPITINA